MKLNIIYILLTITLVFTGCKQSSTSMLPTVTGQLGDVLVVMNKGKWDRIAGDTIRSVLMQAYPGLPKLEPKFNPIFVPTDGFTRIFHSQRNIIIGKIGPGIETSQIKVKRNLWANTQLILQIEANNDSAFAHLVHQNKKRIVEIINEAERKRIISTYKAKPNASVVSKLRENHNINLTVPTDYSINVEKDNFVWIYSEHRDIVEGLFVYYYDYKAKNTFTQDFLLNQRNTFLMQHVEGEKEGSFMTTEMRFPPVVNEFYLKDSTYTFEMRGLWKMQDGFAMGGPFISISQYDEKRQRIVTVEGFVFAPAHDKTKYIRRAEAILYSLSFPE